ncbi:MAG: hypothetical protein K6E79_08150 [Pseudobutyrivibrio sp.]|nr:hypothetical protein [Pseudobutyrivibrio sp.]
MKTLEVALCDLDEDYILRFASYVIENIPSIQLNIFTTPESYFAQSKDFDVAIITEDFDEVASFRNQGVVGHRYYIIENEDSMEDEDRIYKYQSIECILDRIIEFDPFRGKVASIKKSTGKSKLIGVYSPNSHELQLPFSMALSHSLASENRVLFIDIEELSIMPDLMGKDQSENLMDLLYEINTNYENFNIEKYVKHFMGFDYVEPFRNPNDIAEIDQDSWTGFFNMLEKQNYDAIVILFGRTINGFTDLIKDIDKLYVLGRPGDYFKKGQEAFIDYLNRANIDADSESVILPMSASNLSEGAYLLEELLQGNLGVFVRKIIGADSQDGVAYA